MCKPLIGVIPVCARLKDTNAYISMCSLREENKVTRVCVSVCVCVCMCANTHYDILRKEREEDDSSSQKGQEDILPTSTFTHTLTHPLPFLYGWTQTCMWQCVHFADTVNPKQCPGRDSTLRPPWSKAKCCTTKLYPTYCSYRQLTFHSSTTLSCQMEWDWRVLIVTTESSLTPRRLYSRHVHTRTSHDLADAQTLWHVWDSHTHTSHTPTGTRTHGRLLCAQDVWVSVCECVCVCMHVGVSLMCSASLHLEYSICLIKVKACNKWTDSVQWLHLTSILIILL